MARHKILILTSAHLCRNPRVVKEATALGSAGHDVTVMSISVQQRFERMDRELMRGLPFKRVVLDYAADTPAARLADFFQRSATWTARRVCSELEVETAQPLGPATALLRLGSKPFQLREAPALVIAPHQDDETLACGGIIARKRNEGLPVHVVFITDGSASHPGHARLVPPVIATLRQQEAMRAMAYLGVERTAVHFLNEPDGTLKTISAERRENLIARLTEIGRASCRERV